MSETRGSDKLRWDLETVLRAWPEVEKDEEEWENRAETLVARLRRGERGATSAELPDHLLSTSPLGQSDERGHNSAATGGSAFDHPDLTEPIREGKPMTMSADRERDRRSLQDLAKMAHGLTPPPSSVAPSGVHRAVEAEKEDSGIVDLAVASQVDPQASVRAQSTPLASHGLFDEEPQAAAPASAPPAGPASARASVPASQPPASQDATQPLPSLPPTAPPSVAPASLPQPAGAPVAANAAVANAPRQAEGKGRGGMVALLVGGVVALGAAAAGGFLLVKSQNPVEAEPVAMTAVEATPAEPVAEPPAEEPAATAEAEPAEPTPDELPSAMPEEPEVVAAAPAPKRGAKAAPAAKPAAAPKPKPEGPVKMTEKDLAASPSGSGLDLGAAIQKEVGDDGSKTATPAAATTGNAPRVANVPRKPSQGAVTGAIGAVLRGARACLGPDDPVSRASIVFGSDGTVQSVSVTGGAKGKPAEACIKSALMKAKLQPFAEPSYTANITVRH